MRRGGGTEKSNNFREDTLETNPFPASAIGALGYVEEVAGLKMQEYPVGVAGLVMQEYPVGVPGLETQGYLGMQEYPVEVAGSEIQGYPVEVESIVGIIYPGTLENWLGLITGIGVPGNMEGYL